MKSLTQTRYISQSFLWILGGPLYGTTKEFTLDLWKYFIVFRFSKAVMNKARWRNSEKVEICTFVLWSNVVACLSTAKGNQWLNHVLSTEAIYFGYIILSFFSRLHNSRINISNFSLQNTKYKMNRFLDVTSASLF